MNKISFLFRRASILTFSMASACGGELFTTGGGGGELSTSTTGSGGAPSTSASGGGAPTASSGGFTTASGTGGASNSAGGSGGTPSTSSTGGAPSTSSTGGAPSTSSTGSTSSTSSTGSTSSTSSTGGGGGALDTVDPFVIFTTPLDQAIDVPRNADLTATFDEPMAPLTINDTTFLLKEGANLVDGTVNYAGTTATLVPSAQLLANTAYTATVTVGATDLNGNPLASAKTWTFKTGMAVAKGPPVVHLGTARGFVGLAKSGITTIPSSALTGDIGVSPIDSTALTGFPLTLDPSGVFATTPQVIGKVYAANYATPTPGKLTVAIGDMEAAYTDAAGRLLPDFVDTGAGEIGGLDLVPGLYRWGTDVSINTDVTFDGGPDDVWILQIAGGVSEASNIDVFLAGGAQAKNIFWQASGVVGLKTGAHLEGIVLSKMQITLATDATVEGRLFSQTALTLDAATVTQPAP